jgi:WD40 repeat protein
MKHLKIKRSKNMIKTAQKYTCRLLALTLFSCTDIMSMNVEIIENSPQRIAAKRKVIPSHEGKKRHQRELVEVQVKKMLRTSGITPSIKEQNSSFLALPDNALHKIFKFAGIVWHVRKTVPLSWIQECIQIKNSPTLIAIDLVKNVNIFDFQKNNHLKHTFKCNSGYYKKFDLSSETTMAVTSWHNICLYDLTSGTHIKTLQGHEDDVTVVTMLPDGTLASGSKDSTVKIWNLQSGACIKTLQERAWITSLTVLPDGTLASGSWDTTIKLWNNESRECISTLMGHTDCINDLIVLPNGKLASSSNDGTIKIWHQNSCIKTLSVSPRWIESLAALSSHKFISHDIQGNIYLTQKNYSKKIHSVDIDSENRCIIVKAISGGSFLSGHVNNMRIWKSLPDFGVSCEKTSQQSK